MKSTRIVKNILANYKSDNAGSLSNLQRILMQGKLGGTGKMVILPVDQGFEHGPARSFAPNEAAYDPAYHFQLAIDAGLSAYATPLGMMEAAAADFAGQIPTILKVNSANSLSGFASPNQAVTGTVKDALRLGCSAIGFTIYPGSDHCYDMMEEFRELAAEAKANGLAVVLWSYARGGKVSSPEGETAIDTISYAAHMAALLGAHIIKVKLQTDHLDGKESGKAYKDNNIDISTSAARVKDVVNSCFAGKRLVVFSGGSTKGANAVYDDARAIRDGGGNGSIIGRNTFQRPREEALEMLANIVEIYKGRA